MLPEAVNDLTAICLLGYKGFVSIFEVLAEPNRRSILGLLRAQERPVGELVGYLNVSQPAISKHLRILREAGLVESRVDGQRRLYRVNPEPLRALDRWLGPYRQMWAASLDDLQQHLDTFPDGDATL